VLRERLDAWLGPAHAARKLAAGAAALTALALALATGEHRITARGELQPSQRRALVAPFDGYVAEAPLRAGDAVQRGALLARLDDRELGLEHLRLQTQLEQLASQSRQALGERDAAQARMLAARVAEARSQLGLVEAQLERARLFAPFDGVIVRGDLSQSLGAPVSRGDVLFEVAPPVGYRVVLRVDERDVRDVAVGQRGALVLAAAPESPLDFSVAKLTPISIAEDGANYFEVEAALDRPAAHLRPGMEGVGKISVGERALVAIWTRDAWTWLRLALWRLW
jgi:RND family efflux transporter MFP subunit